MIAHCRFLPWDTTFFGPRIARLDLDSVDASQMAAALAWCQDERIDCLYFLARLDDAQTVRIAEGAGFGLKDIRVTYSRRPQGEIDGAGLPEGLTIRSADPGDVEALVSIAQDAFTDSRYYFDTRFPRERSSSLYAVWVRNSFEGEKKKVWVIDEAGAGVGFITCQMSDERTGQVGLAAVASHLRGRRLGRPLYKAALGWFAHQGAEEVIYVTQARNIGAQRLIQHLGFRISATHLWYHKWFDRPELLHCA